VVNWLKIAKPGWFFSFCDLDVYRNIVNYVNLLILCLLGVWDLAWCSVDKGVNVIVEQVYQLVDSEVGTCQFVFFN